MEVLVLIVLVLGWTALMSSLLKFWHILFFQFKKGHNSQKDHQNLRVEVSELGKLD